MEDATQTAVSEKEKVAEDVEAVHDVADSMAAEKRANDLADKAEAERLAKEAAEKAAENAARLARDLLGEDRPENRANRAEEMNDGVMKQTAREKVDNPPEESAGKVVDNETDSNAAADGNSDPARSVEKVVDNAETDSSAVDESSGPARNDESPKVSSDAPKPTSSPEVKSEKGDLLKVGSTVPDFNCCCHDGTVIATLSGHIFLAFRNADEYVKDTTLHEFPHNI